jgi:hypothetical protein
VTNNPYWKAPIQLYPEPSTDETKIKNVKVKLRRNHTVASSANYEKSYTPWTGHAVEGYCNFTAMLDEYIKQASLNNVNEQASSISLYLVEPP